VASGTPNQEGYSSLMGQVLEQIQSMFPDYAYEAVLQAQEQDYINSLLETNPALDTPTVFTVEDALKNVIVSDGVSQSEINYVVGLLSKNLVTIDDVVARTGIPAETISAVYEANKPAVDDSEVGVDEVDEGLRYFPVLRVPHG
jgi:hypothetical protein